MCRKNVTLNIRLGKAEKVRGVTEVFALNLKMAIISPNVVTSTVRAMLDLRGYRVSPQTETQEGF